jgi:hypothetical protein
MYRKYKVYFYDKKIGQQYPVEIAQKDLSSLCLWINSYAPRWNLEVISAQLLDYNGNYLKDVQFLPTEIMYQYFIVPLEQRLIAYYEFMHGGV